MAKFGEEHNRFDLIPEYEAPVPNARNRVFLTKDGAVRANPDLPETDLDRLRKEREANGPLDLSP